MSGRDTAEIRRIPRGTPYAKCPNCGPILGDDVDMRFPVGADCANCGAGLDRAGVSSETVEVKL